LHIPLHSLFSLLFHAPLYLPSFPTRRSSDLFLFANSKFNPKITRFLFANPPFKRKSRVFSLRIPHLTQKSHLFSSQIPHLSENQDRKSTRLNSSHVSISYAVFCLKTKKKQLD